MTENRLSKWIIEIDKDRKAKEQRIKNTVSKFSQLSGLEDGEIFDPESTNKLYFKWKNHFLDRWSFSSVNNIYGEFRRVNDLQSILEALEVNFNIRLNYELTSSEKRII